MRGRSAVTRSCSLPAGAVSGEVVTIEGLSPDSRRPVQVAWLAHQVPQCGYCQSGQIMAAATLLGGHRRVLTWTDDAGVTQTESAIVVVA
jgi:isoquinoline 1-oxidoreductase alpha subunit